MINSQLKRIIVVLGMHRSGTSVITRGLKVLGVELGDNFWPAGPDNERGFWESYEVIALNEVLLKKLHSSMARIGPLDFDLLRSDFFLLERNLAVEILRKNLEKNSIFGFKDPRVSILLPFWQSVFRELNLADSYVFAVRNPLNICQSLLKRNNIPVKNSMLLWYKYIYSSILYTQDRPRVFINYDFMLENPRKQINRIAQQLLLPSCICKKELEDYTQTFLTTTLRHHKFSVEDLINDTDVPEIMDNLYIFLDKLSKDIIVSNSEKFTMIWESLKNSYRDYLPLLKIIDSIEKSQDATINDLTIIRSSLENHIEINRKLSAHVGNLKRALSSEIKFDERYYLRSYPDIAASDIDPYRHFIEYGIKEGRSGVLPEFERAPIDPTKDTILLVSHDATRTGAPILALNICMKLREKYNVIVLLLGGGPLCCYFEQYANVVFGPLDNPRNVINYSLNKVYEKYSFAFCIANTIESRYVLKSLYSKDIFTILLVHEFFGAPYPVDEFIDAFRLANITVFPSKLVQKSAYNDMTQQLLLNSCVFPQGKSIIPIRNKDGINSFDLIKNKIIGTNLQKNPFIVLGAGTRNFRKGIDLFIETAVEIKNKYPDANIIMVWVGASSEGFNDEKYTSDLEKLITSSNLERSFFLFDEIDDFEEIYQVADMFYLSSRLDPLPNVAIDSMLKGLPIICFSETTGVCEYLEQDVFTTNCILPYLDISAAANKIIEIYSSSELINLLSIKVEEIAKKSFNMDNYINFIIKTVENKSFCNNGIFNLDEVI